LPFQSQHCTASTAGRGTRGKRWRGKSPLTEGIGHAYGPTGQRRAGEGEVTNNAGGNCAVPRSFTPARTLQAVGRSDARDAAALVGGDVGGDGSSGGGRASPCDPRPVVMERHGMPQSIRGRVHIVLRAGAAQRWIPDAAGRLKPVGREPMDRQLHRLRTWRAVRARQLPVRQLLPRSAAVRQTPPVACECLPVAGWRASLSACAAGGGTRLSTTRTARPLAASHARAAGCAI
jgi:hypothetical protein